MPAVPRANTWVYVPSALSVNVSVLVIVTNCMDVSYTACHVPTRSLSENGSEVATKLDKQALNTAEVVTRTAIVTIKLRVGRDEPCVAKTAEAPKFGSFLKAFMIVLP